jgi:hypothetical protein
VSRYGTFISEDLTKGEQDILKELLTSPDVATQVGAVLKCITEIVGIAGSRVS